MKMIITVTFLGILMHAFAEECELMQAAKDFDSEKYFSIRRAYAIYSKNGPKENVCRLYKTKKNSDDTPKTLVFEDYKNGERPRKTLLECTNTPKTGSKGQFDVECQDKRTNGTNKIQLETSVLATDNKSYVVLQRCSKTATGNNTEDIVVLQRFKVGVEKGVEDYFDTQGWTFNKWISRENANCVKELKL
uniref:Putative salivary lipocalin n=1 Tax=Panstrongylus lignarius TaxID=156445 RepID=A0A224XYY6_9HEMI